MWRKVCGYDCYVEGGKIIRALKDGGTVPAYVYKKSKGGGWDNVTPCNVNTFRSGFHRGLYTIM